MKLHHAALGALLWLLQALWPLTAAASPAGRSAATPRLDSSVVFTSRPDGRFLSSRGTVQRLMASREPALAFDPAFTPRQFRRWQGRMRDAMRRLMTHPDVECPAPRRVCTVQRDGYRVEKWESYPLPSSVVPFLVLVPDSVTEARPAPAVLCIPGFGQTKELLAGERVGNYSLAGAADSVTRPAAMALHYVRRGLVAVAVDNVSCGELSDEGYFDYLATSRFLLETGWSYLGLCSYQDKLVLDWMKTQPGVDRRRIIVSGFSLGTEPMMVLGLMDESICAFVYNDFLCRTRERALTMTAPDARGQRAFPNSIEHLIPGFLTLFDFPDIVAALAPRPVICTEGGMDRDFLLIREAYAKAGAPDRFEYHHYARYADPSARQPLEHMPEGVDRATFFRLANVDPPNHYFKREWVMPWLDRLLAE